MPFITGLFDIGEKLSVQTGGMFELSPVMHASRIVYWFLKTVDDQENRRQILLECLRNTVGLSLPVHFVSIQEQALTEARAGESPLLDSSTVEELKGILRPKIETAATNGDLDKNPHLLMILFRWSGWGGLELGKAFCARLASSQVGALKLLKAFVARGLSQSMGDYVGREHWFIQLANIEYFLPWEDVAKSLAGVDETALSPEHKRAFDAFQEAIERRKEGKKDFGTTIGDV
jgi:hypothetical protein